MSIRTIATLLERAPYVTLPRWARTTVQQAAYTSLLRSQYRHAHMPDVSAAPIRTKEDMRREQLPDASSARCYLEKTSGSTGVPLYVALDSNTIPLRRAAYARALTMMPIQQQSFRLVRMLQRERMGFEDIGTRHYISGMHDVDDVVDQIATACSQASHPIVLETFASYVYRYAQWIHQGRARMPRCIAIMPLGEQLSPEEYAFIENVLQCPMYPLYVLREVGLVGHGCGYMSQDTVHVNRELVHVEIVDACGQPVPSGTAGRVVVTDRHNRVQPIVRYDTGDLGVLRHGVCQCGRTLPRLTFHGRSGSYIVTPSQRQCNPVSLFRYFNRHNAAVRNFQMQQHAENHIHVLLDIEAGGATTGIARDIVENIAEALNHEVMITYAVARNGEEFMTVNGKRQAFISYV